MTTNFQVGDRVSFSVGSDCYPATVVRKTPTTLVVQEDQFTADKANGHDYYGKQVWKFTRDPKGIEWKFTLRADGKYREVGTKYGGALSRGWKARQDPHF